MKETIYTYFNTVKLEILRAKTEEAEEQAKKSIRAFTEEIQDEGLDQQLWDFYDLIINYKTKK